MKQALATPRRLAAEPAAGLRALPGRRLPTPHGTGLRSCPAMADPAGPDRRTARPASNKTPARLQQPGQTTTPPS